MNKEELDGLIVEMLSDPKTTMEELDSLAAEYGFCWQFGIMFDDEVDYEYVH